MSEEPVKVKVKRKIIEGVSYFLDAENILYNPQTKAEVGLWDEESQTIKPLPEEEDDEEDDEEEEDENADVVTRFEFEGKKYLRSKKTGVIYNLDEEVIGKWNEAKNRIDFDEPDDEEDDEEDDDNEPNENVFYLSENAGFFDNSIEKRRPDGSVYNVPTFDTGVRLSNSFMSEDIVKFSSGGFGLGIPTFVETNGIARLLGRSNNEKYSYSVNFINEDDEVVGRRVDNDREIVGIYSPSKKAFVALFDFDKKHTTLESNDADIVNAFEEYSIPKVLFMKPETLYNYKQKPLKLPPLEKALDDAKRDLEAEADPAIQKVIRSLMKKIISSITKAIEFDDAEVAKKERYDALDIKTKQQNKELKTEQTRVKKEIQDKKDEKKRLLVEKKRKEKEDADAKAAAKIEADTAYRLKKEQEKQSKKPEVKSSPQALYDRLKAEQDRKQQAIIDRKKAKEAEEKTGVGIDDPALYEKAKQIADATYSKPSAYKSGFIVKKYKEMGGTYSGKKGNKGIGRWFKEDWKDVGNEEYPVYRPTKRVSKDTPLTPDEIKPSNLKKQIALKQVIKGDANLPPFEGGKLKGMKNEDKKRQEVMEYSDPKKAYENAIKYLKKDIVFSLSTKPKKKYMVMNPDTMKWTHFGEIGYEDFLKHQDPKRQNNYLKRTANMKGNWKNDKYSANNLAREILWR